MPQQQILPASACLQSFFSRIGILIQESFGRDHETGRAVAALHRIPLAVGLDQGIPLLVGGNPFDGFDRLPSHSTASVVQERTARPSIMTVQEPQTPRSHICLAPVRPELELERALQSPVRLDQHLVFLAVDLEFGGHRKYGPGMRRGKMAFQSAVGIEVLGADGAPEIGDRRGCGFDCGRGRGFRVSASNRRPGCRRRRQRRRS